MGNIFNSSHSITTAEFCWPVLLRLCPLNRQYQPHSGACQTWKFPGPTRLHHKDNLRAWGPNPGFGECTLVITMHTGYGNHFNRASSEQSPSYAGIFIHCRTFHFQRCNKQNSHWYSSDQYCFKHALAPNLDCFQNLSSQTLRTLHYLIKTNKWHVCDIFL